MKLTASFPPASNNQLRFSVSLTVNLDAQKLNYPSIVFRFSDFLRYFPTFICHFPLHLSAIHNSALSTLSLIDWKTINQNSHFFNSNKTLVSDQRGFPGGSVVTILLLMEMQEMGVLSLSQKIPRIRTWQPTPVFLPGKSHGHSSLLAYTSWGLSQKCLSRVHFIFFFDSRAHTSNQHHWKLAPKMKSLCSQFITLVI